MSIASIAEVTARLTAPGQPFEMEERDIRGIPTRVWKHAPPSLAAILQGSAAFGDRDFLVYENERWSYARHFNMAARLAEVLIERHGIVKGDRVAVAMRNFPEWPVAFWGAAAAGAVVVPLNAWWTGAELLYGLRDSGTRVLICDGERLARIESELPALRGEGLVTLVVRHSGSLPEGVERFEDVMGVVPGDMKLPAVAIDPEDDATIFYTSGTTGNPKGVVGTHRNICGNLLSLGFVIARNAARTAAAAAAGLHDAGPAAPQAAAPGQGVNLVSVPFFHATGCHSILVANLAAGNRLVLMHKWDPARALELIERERVTNCGGVPAMVWQMIDHPDFARRDLSSLRGIGYGGAPAAPELVRRIAELFPGRTPSNGYGLTETSSVTTMNAGYDYLRHPDSVGVPIPVCDVKVVDEEGRELPTGEAGELWIKGPNVVKGYFNKPKETQASFTDGWLHSGDVARIDAEGFVYLVDRAKDLLIRGGENISSVEVEAALFEHPAVTDAAVIGIPHQVLGEEVGAVVHLKHGMTATEEELKRHVAQRLAGFKVPVKIWFYDEPLPRNPAGKILKRDLRKQLVDGLGS
ncbi:MAG TPA: class I adenylate-forming enzyme family protein [Candidatus Limnocylindrales bacterium]|nr:class I adenylate-forming enzyme family protein [Candidatus Limnocylindrales bacterium]